MRVSHSLSSTASGPENRLERPEAAWALTFGAACHWGLEGIMLCCIRVLVLSMLEM